MPPWLQRADCKSWRLSQLPGHNPVFAACDRLDAANERWNREDVRNEVGGGGYVVIDPLISAWRELKPLRELAPSTPTELLYQVAASLETHLTGFVGEAEERLSDSRKVFDATVSELSEKLAALEGELAEKAQVSNQRDAGRESRTDKAACRRAVKAERRTFGGAGRSAQGAY